MVGRAVSRRSVLAAGTAVAAGAVLGHGSAAAGAAGSSRGLGPRSPHTDPNNDGSWVIRAELSDEFDGNCVNPARWNTEPNSWGTWRWNPDDVEVSGGTAKLHARWNPSDAINPTAIGWPQTVTGGSGTAHPGVGHPAYVTTEFSSDGTADLVQTSDAPYRVSSDGIVTNLPDGTYTFRARINSSGGQYETRMSVSSYAAGAPRLDAPIHRSHGYVLYEIADIRVTSGTAKLTFFSDSPAGRRLLIRDVEFVAEGTTRNLAPNPGFRNRSILNWDSGILRSRRRIRYGYFEARLKTAGAGGTPNVNFVNSAFWLARTDPCSGGRWTELDVEEPGGAHRINHASHVWKHPCGGGLHEGFVVPVSFNPNDDFHIYALEWDQDQIVWYVDGEVQRTRATMPYFDQPLQLMFSQSKPWMDQEHSPLTMEVDYVRVWQKAGTPLVGNDPCTCGDASDG